MFQLELYISLRYDHSSRKLRPTKHQISLTVLTVSILFQSLPKGVLRVSNTCSVSALLRCMPSHSGLSPKQQNKSPFSEMYSRYPPRQQLGGNIHANLNYLQRV